MAAGVIRSHSLGLSAPQRAGARRRVLAVRAAKKGPSPWSSGGPKRGSGGKADTGNAGRGGAGGDKSTGSANGQGSASGAHGRQPSGDRESSGGSPWKDVPSRQGLPSKSSKGSGAGGGFGTGARGGFGSAGGGRVTSRPAAPPEITFTDPINVTLLDELSPPESAAEPKWGTFCSHLNGEWVGQYAAYTPWEGKPEPAWIDDRGKYVSVVYTRALEQRVKEAAPAGAPDVGASGGVAAAEDGEDVLVRKIGRCTRLAALSDLRLRPPLGQDQGLEGQGQQGGVRAGEAEKAGSDAAAAVASNDDDDDADVEALSFNSDGVVIFDGGNYSAGPEFIGQQPIKLVNDEAIVGISEDEAAGAGPGGAQRPDAVRAQSGAAASTSAPRRDGSGGNDEEEEGEVDDDDDDPDGSTVLPTSTSVFEQCLVDWGSRTRARLKMTLRIGQLDSGEVDVEVLRILLFVEEWQGPAASERLATPPAQVKVLARDCTELPRPTPVQLQGSWNVFTVCATGVDEVDPFSGEERVAWVYSSTEEQQLWDTSAAPPSGEDGGCFWLPGGIVLSLRMVDNYVPVDLDLESGSGSGSESDGGLSRGSSRESSNGNGNGAPPEARSYPRGLCIGMSWLWREGSVSQLEREYDGYGYLREVRLAQAVKGGWSGVACDAAGQG